MTMDLVIFVTSTIVAFLIAMQFYIQSQLDEIKEHWIQQRCNPLYMPFAGLVGVDVAGNFTRCTMKSFQDQAGFILDPINQLFATFLNMFSSIADSLHSIRKAIFGIRDGFLKMVSMVFGKLANTMSQMHQLMNRIRTVFMRLVGVFAVLVGVLHTGVESGKSVLNGPIGKTLGFFDQLCFDSEQDIALWSGEIRLMREVRVGDILEDGSKVTAVQVLSGDQASLQDLHGVRVTASHLMADGRRVEEVPEAKSIPCVPNLCCFDTDTHRISVNGVVFQDFGWEQWKKEQSVHKLGQGFLSSAIVGFRFSEEDGWEVLAVDM